VAGCIVIICSHVITCAASVLVLSSHNRGTAIHPAGSIRHTRLSVELATGSISRSGLGMEVAARARNFSTRVVCLHGSLHALLLVVETWKRCRRLTMGEEPVVASGLHALADPAGMQTVTRRHDRDIAGHHARVAQVCISYIKTANAHVTAAKVVSIHSGDTGTDALIPQRHVDVGNEGLASANAQWPDKPAITHVDDVDIRDVHDVYPIEAASPPREARIKRPDRNPADRAEAERKAAVTAKADEGHECRSPNWPEADLDRAWPPYP